MSLSWRLRSLTQCMQEAEEPKKKNNNNRKKKRKSEPKPTCVPKTIWNEEEELMLLKIFEKMRKFQGLLQAYLNAKAPAYGMRERMKADNIFPNKSTAALLSQGDPFKKTAISEILD
ncbi:unnamed protein product [Microthlaspi erraticum]|uniref:Uncharacterized protein n=1 Tax=Microthlaspi erraticum TaxID=1685480 RepID=A0A6D2JJW1_9BRAS|nr:unnamed protein product [Microthlaspi erraticum]